MTDPTPDEMLPEYDFSKGVRGRVRQPTSRRKQAEAGLAVVEGGGLAGTLDPFPQMVLDLLDERAEWKSKAFLTRNVARAEIKGLKAEIKRLRRLATTAARHCARTCPTCVNITLEFEA